MSTQGRASLAVGGLAAASSSWPRRYRQAWPRRLLRPKTKGSLQDVATFKVPSENPWLGRPGRTGTAHTLGADLPTPPHRGSSSRPEDNLVSSCQL